MKLLFNAFFKFICGFIIIALLLFLSAGSINFFNGWLFIALLFIPMFILGICLLIKDPELLKNRLNAKEEQNSQKGVVAISGLIFLVGFIIAGLDFRFGWSKISNTVIVVFSVIFLISYAFYAEVMRENTYLSRTIKVEEGQMVVDTALYGVVRHPMYAVTLWLFLSIPIILGSWWSFACFVPYIAVVAVRILNEEKLLEQKLEGYVEYKKKVKYRLIPFIW